MKRDTFLPSITTLIIFGMTLFLSCAHQNRVRDGLNEQAANEEEAFVSEEGSIAQEGEAPQGELSELSEPPPVDAATAEGAIAAEGTPVEGAVAEAVPSTSTEDADLKALGIDSTTPPTDTASLEATTSLDTTAGAITTDPATTDTAAAITGTEGTDPLAGLDSAAAGGAATAGAYESTTPSEPPPATNNIEITHMEPILDNGSPKGSSRESFSGSSSWSGNSTVPKIPSRSVTRRGTELNRFYMVRSGDTAESLSKLFYGNEDHAADIAKWNGKNFTPGKVVYYKSAIEPDDQSMRSFYQEKGVQPEEYTVAKGDWLSKVAKKQLGHPKSWKEIAVVNGMNSPDSLEVGQKIAIYPKDLSNFTREEPKEEPQPVAQVPEPVREQQPQQPVQAPQNQPVDPNAEMAKQMPPEPPPVQEPVKPAKPQPQQPVVDSSKVLEQNLPAVFILGGVLVLSVLYLVVRRKKSRKPLDEFGDDNFAPPTKLKRK